LIQEFSEFPFSNFDGPVSFHEGQTVGGEMLPETFIGVKGKDFLSETFRRVSDKNILPLLQP
jgi:hypothetical protein